MRVTQRDVRYDTSTLAPPRTPPHFQTLVKLFDDAPPPLITPPPRAFPIYSLTFDRGEIF